MILVDTSIWIDHLRAGDSDLKALLTQGQVLMHPFIIGELALGNLHERTMVLRLLSDLPRAIMSSEEETLMFITQHSLFGLGIRYVDAHLLASARLNNVQLWTRDKRLHAASVLLGLAVTA